MYTKLITVETRAIFDTIQASENPIPLTSTVFILDTLQYWTHGVFLNGITATEVSNDVTLRIAGSNYTFTKSDNIHKKNQDVDLGVHQQTVGLSTYNVSYILKATDNHKLLQYIERSSSDKAIYLGNTGDKLIIYSKDSIIRTYTEGNATHNVTMLDSSNSSISIDANQFKYRLGGSTDSILYLARHDVSGVLPENNNALKASRLGGNNNFGWIVMNTAMSGDSNNYYEIKISNDLNPITYVKSSSYSNFLQLLSINDTFVPPTNGAGAKNGAVPAPSVNSEDYFLNSAGNWTRAIPSKVNDSYLYVDSEGTIQWRPSTDINSENETKVASLSNIALTGNWTNVDNLSTRLGNSGGSYIIQITYGSQLYTGVFSYIINGYDTDDEIILHCSNASETINQQTRGRLYAKVGSSDNTLFLQLAATSNESNAILSIKYKKLL